MAPLDSQVPNARQAELLARRAFGFLRREFDFVDEEAPPPFVSYRSRWLRVRVYWDSERGAEADIRISRLVDPATWPTYGLSEFAKLSGTRFHAPGPTYTDEDLGLAFDRLANALRELGLLTLQGDRSQLHEIDQLREEAGMRPPPN